MDSTTTRPHTDRKTLRKQQQKKIAQGHAQDDHEEEQTWQQTMCRSAIFVARICFRRKDRYEK